MNTQEEKWYALFVKTGEEDHVKDKLAYTFSNRQQIQFFVPKRKLRERKNGQWAIKIRTLMPGYILLHGFITVEDYYTIQHTPALITVLKDGKGELLRIPEHEIEVIHRLMSNGELIDTSTIMVEGRNVVVVDGPLKGLEGIIESVDKRKGRAKVRMEFIGEPRIVELSVSVIQG